MARQLNTEIEINANAQRVWEILTDFASYPAWNTFIPRIAGRVEENAKLFFIFTTPFRVRAPAVGRMLKVVPQRELRWAGQLPIPGLIRAEHYHVIEPLGADRIRFIHGEIFTGLLVAPLWPLFAERGLRLYEESSLALKRRAEMRQHE
jgi:hypothetical protein